MTDAATQGSFPERQQPFPRGQAALEAARCLYCFDAPCMVACPTSIDIPSFIKSIQTGDELGAADTIMRSNIMGASCGRVCETDALCEGSCVLGPTGKPIEIGRLQRHATDVMIETGAPIPYAPGADSGRTVAIVGGGPAGLAAAANLREAGHAVTIFERMDELGGLGRYGIIPVRQPNAVVAWEVEQVLALGVQARVGVEVGRDVSVDQLRGEFDAVLLTTGAGRYVQQIGLENADVAGVEDALVFIEQSRTKAPAQIAVGRNVVVVGGGNTAMDAATIAVHLDVPQVTVAYRRTQAEMTAYQTEVDFCLRSGVAFEFLAQPLRVVGEGGRAVALECGRVVLGEPEADGRRRPQIGDERFQIPADHILLATGQKREPSLYEQLSVDLLPDGRPAVGVDAQTSVRGVFACGDAVSKGANLSVVDAVAQGRDAVLGINDFLLAAVPA